MPLSDISLYFEIDWTNSECYTDLAPRTEFYFIPEKIGCSLFYDCCKLLKLVAKYWHKIETNRTNSECYVNLASHTMFFCATVKMCRKFFIGVQIVINELQDNDTIIYFGTYRIKSECQLYVRYSAAYWRLEYKISL